MGKPGPYIICFLAERFVRAECAHKSLSDQTSEMLRWQKAALCVRNARTKVSPTKRALRARKVDKSR